MPNAQHLRAQIEASLAQRIPSALTPQVRVSYPVVPTGIHAIDDLLGGGFPVGAISELVGPECSGRTSLALTFAAAMTQAGKVCAWVDVADTLHPESAAALGVDLARLLWIRCGAASGLAPLTQADVHSLRMAEKPARVKPGLPTGGSGHPRMEANGLSEAVSDLLSPRCAEPQHKPRPERQATMRVEPVLSPRQRPAAAVNNKKPWSRLEQALKVTDLLLQAGGFSCIVLDMGSLKPEHALRVPLATWFRFRTAAQRLQSNFLLLTQHACSKNSAGLVLHLEPGRAMNQQATIFSGMQHRAVLEQQRFAQPPGNLFPMRKQPQSVPSAEWQGRTVWAGKR